MTTNAVQYWAVTCLGLPSWLTADSERNGTELRLRRSGVKLVRQVLNEKGDFNTVPTGGVDEVITPDGEDVVMVAPKSGWIAPLSYQDIQMFGQWKHWPKGPLYEKGRGINRSSGERIFIVPYSMIGQESEVQQPW